MNISGTTGATGAAGADGYSFINGSGVPGAGLGNNGDSYIDTGSAGVDLYTKSGGVWIDTGIDLVGATGAAGTNGTDGYNFLQGVGVPGSGLGNNGDSYLDSDTGDLYIKSAGSWTLTGNLIAGSTMSQYSFIADKTATQNIAAAGEIIRFEDDLNAPFFDTNNDFFIDQYIVPKGGLTMKFALDGVHAIQNGGATTIDLMITVDGIEEVSTGNQVIGAASTYVPSLVTDFLSLNAGQVVRVEVKTESGAGTCDMTSGRFSNSFA